MKHEKMLKKALAKIETPDIEKIIPNEQSERKVSRAPRAKRHISATAVAVILCCAMVLGAAAATTAPLIKKILNDKLVTENTQQLTVVPEGYMGIYTKEELLALNDFRENPSPNYILMNDIEFTEEDYAPGGILEGGFKSIVPNRVKSENGWYIQTVNTFNGNGHVIRNLRFAPDEIGQYGLFQDSVNNIINLGIEDCTIYVEYEADDPEGDQMPYLRVGAVAAQADYVGACYVDGLTVDVKLTIKDRTPERGQTHSLWIGGLVGETQYIDSCYVNNATIRVSGTGLEAAGSGAPDKALLSVGGIAGVSFSCVTSWFSGEISNTVTGEFVQNSTDPITERKVSETFPLLMVEETFAELDSKVKAKYGEKNFTYKKFKAYYIKKDLDSYANSERAAAEATQLFDRLNHMTGGKMDLDNQRVWYVFDPHASLAEETIIYDILLEAYGGDSAAVAQMCEYAYIKSGAIGCYELDLGGALSSEDLPEFDFDTVWTFRDGKPIQQIFAH